MSDRSFVRFGGLAGVLLAITSWAAVTSFYTVAARGQDPIGLQTFQLLYALIAFWALFGIVAVYWVTRPFGEAWSFFATLVGVGASLATITSSLYGAAVIREVIARPELRTPAATASDPLNVMSFALTGLWFLIANVLLARARYPRLLTALGFIAVADLFVGFFAALSGAVNIVTYAGVIAGAIGGPLYWLWLGMLLRRRA
ncbi:MAG TPA: hypothetical protein VM052_04315 [Candidatus Limnocylindrales bacterium]|nr:hypothetical protein [Candidatus Limnocylindrales bacterium]